MRAGVAGRESTGFWTRPLGGTQGPGRVVERIWTLTAWFLLPLGDLSRTMSFLALGFFICTMGMNPTACGTAVSLLP